MDVLVGEFRWSFKTLPLVVCEGPLYPFIHHHLLPSFLNDGHSDLGEINFWCSFNLHLYDDS